MQKVIFLRGCPASGKTTWCKENCDWGKGLVRVSRDDIREMDFQKSGQVKEFEDLVTAIEHSTITNILSSGASLVIDATLASTKYLKSYFNLFYNKDLDLTFELKEFGLDLTLEEILDRNSRRSRVVPQRL